MADVRLSIAGREYIVTCKDGEEDRLNALGRLVDAKAREAGGAGGLNESRQLLFASLLLADQLFDAAPKETGASDSKESNAALDTLAETVEKLAVRLETLAQALEDRA
jgi:cell division protein ZapA